MLNQQRRGWPWAAAALLLGLALRLWFIAHAALIAGDSVLYGSIAKNWLQAGVYGFSQGPAGPLPTLIRLPGYPLFLLTCFRIFGIEHYTPVVYVQCLIDLGACILLAALARRLFGHRAGLAALLLSALCPFTASYVATPLTETLTLACIVLAFYSLVRWQEASAGFNRWILPLSFALAYAVLLRPEQGLLAAVVLPAMLWLAVLRGTAPRRSFARATLPVALTAVCTLLPLLPWTIRNERTFHDFQPLAPRYANDPGELVPLGFQRWYRSWAIDFTSTEDAYWNYDGAPIQVTDLPSRAFDSEQQFLDTQALLEEYNDTTTPTPAFDARFQALADQRRRQSPVRYYVALPVARLVNMALRPRTEMLPIPLEWWKVRDHPGKFTFALAWAALNLAYFVAGALGFSRWLRRIRAGSLPPAHAVLLWSTAATILLRCALLLTIDNSEPRYTLEFFPVLILWAAVLFSRTDQAVAHLATGDRASSLRPS